MATLDYSSASPDTAGEAGCLGFVTQLTFYRLWARFPDGRTDFALCATKAASSRQSHPLRGLTRAVVRGTRRQLGVAQLQKTALELDALRSVVLANPDDLRGLRDRALLSAGRRRCAAASCAAG